HSAPRRRRLGALLLHRLSQSPAGLSEGVDRSPGELGVCRPAVLESLTGAKRNLPGDEFWGGSILAAALSFADAAWRSLRGSRACGNGGGLGSTRLVNAVFECRPAPFHVNRMGIPEQAWVLSRFRLHRCAGEIKPI